MEKSDCSQDSDEELNELYQQVQGYPLTRSRSANYPSEESAMRVRERLTDLENSITELKWRLHQMEKSTGTHLRWAVRYSQRMAILANTLLGLWHFWIEFVYLIQKRRRVIVQSFLQKNSQTSHQLNSVLSDAYQFAVWRSSFFIICALLISSMSEWKRILGLFVSSIGSFYFTPKHPMGNYFTLFANLLCATAAWSLAPSSPPPKPPKPTLFTNLYRKLQI